MQRCLTSSVPLLAVVACTAGGTPRQGQPAPTKPPGIADQRFEALAAKFIDAYPALSPVNATRLGDHRFDHELDDVSAEAIDEEIDFNRRMLADLRALGGSDLSRANQVDYELLHNRLEYSLFDLEELEEWKWNPLLYTHLTGSAIYALLARDFAPLPERLAAVASRLEKTPRLLEQVRAILVPERVPRVHAETAVKQNPGLISIMTHMLGPQLDSAEPALRERLERAIAAATEASKIHQKWLEEELVPTANGEFRIGAEKFDRKLAFELHTPLTRGEIARRARAEYERVRRDMYEVAGEVLGRELPAEPTPEQLQRTIEEALEVTYRDLPARDEIVAVARRNLETTTRFVLENDLVSVPDDPIEIIVMPEFQRGIALAYCDPPGPLDRGQKTFYAVAPLPESWTDEQVTSFLREYNLWSIEDLTIHEAMPGHYLQLALSNRYPSTLRAVLYSGPFVEGWAVYAERMMIARGYRDRDPRMRLINLKWYLRAITNAIIDQAIHVDGMTRSEAMELMVEGGFQEEREAALKWVRAQLTSTQLSTYFVGYQEHADLRRAAETAWGDAFELKRYHDTVLSFGSPPVQFVRALMLDEPIPVAR